VANRVSGAYRIIDLTPYLGQGTSVSVRKSIREPAGAFSIALLDIVDAQPGGVSDSLYGLLEPMDYVEIRMARSRHEYVGQNLPNGLPIVMRGFIEGVHRTEAIVSGKPVRRITVTGHDYGKIPQIAVIFPAATYATGVDYLTEFPLLRFGFGANNISAAEWITKVVKNILNPFLVGILATAAYDFLSAGAFQGSGPMVLLDVESSISAAVAPYSMQLYQGTVQAFIEQWADLAWNEVFIEDRADGPVMVYRPIPYMNLDGMPIQGGKTPWLYDAKGGRLELTPDDLVEVKMSRTDANVANYFYVTAPAAYLADMQALNYASLTGYYAQTNLDSSDSNCDPGLYGLRLMTVQSNQADQSQIGLNPQDMDEQAKNVYASNWLEWAERRRVTLDALNRDNVVFETGELLIKGNERLKPGNFFNLRRGALFGSYYLHAVEHEFLPFDSFKTRLYVERGTGFLARTKESIAPAWREGNQGAYP
jgi:hypothetical protein